MQSPVRFLDRDARVVKELLDEDTNWWKASQIKEIFNEDEVEKSYSLAISPNKQIDQLT